MYFRWAIACTAICLLCPKREREKLLSFIKCSALRMPHFQQKNNMMNNETNFIKFIEWILEVCICVCMCVRELGVRALYRLCTLFKPFGICLLYSFKMECLVIFRWNYFFSLLLYASAYRDAQRWNWATYKELDTKSWICDDNNIGRCYAHEHDKHKCTICCSEQ